MAAPSSGSDIADGEGVGEETPAVRRPDPGIDRPGIDGPGVERPGAVCGAQTGIEIRVALSTLLGYDERPGEIPGLGLLPAPATRARVALQRRAEWRFAVTDTDGRLISEGTTRHRPTAVGPFPVGHGGIPGGIVEIHIPAVPRRPHRQRPHRQRPHRQRPHRQRQGRRSGCEPG